MARQWEKLELNLPFLFSEFEAQNTKPWVILVSEILMMMKFGFDFFFIHYKHIIFNPLLLTRGQASSVV